MSAFLNAFMPSAMLSAAEFALQQLPMKNFKPDDAVLIPATVLRMRGALVEMQLEDGQMVRTPSENVQQKPETKAVKGPPEHKAISGAPENKSGKGSRQKA